MARLRKDFERSRLGRLLRWISKGSDRLDEDMMASLSASALPALPPEPAERRGQAREQVYSRLLAEEQETYRRARAWGSRRGSRIARRIYLVLSVLFCLTLIVILLQATDALPPFGRAENPMHNEVARRYIEQGMKETGAVNIVAGMILDYRAFDTLGESNVLFTAACAVLILLRISSDRQSDTARQLEMEADDRMFEPKNDLILQGVTRLLVPFILLLGLYIILNGHLSPGGGFSGGAVMGAGLILYLNAFGFRKAERFFTYRTFQTVSVIALSFYALSKAYSFFTGANHLSSIISPGTPGRLFSAGLIPYLNIAVGLVVCCTMYAFYVLFRKGDF